MGQKATAINEKCPRGVKRDTSSGAVVVRCKSRCKNGFNFDAEAKRCKRK
jgi:hypothetical protein